MTLTDKDKLIRELRINPAGCEECEYADSKLNCTRGFQFASACESICEATEVDAVKVVRCKDCKYSVDYYQDGNCYCRRPSKPMEWIEKGFNWFCADGERRTE